jgi:Tfp pilus tip-associated adhesin PilY1
MNTNANTSKMNTNANTNTNNLNNTLNETLNTKHQTNTSPIADETTSNIQQPINKTGWCYIGEDRGFRSCIEVGDNDICMSGNIFPSQDICINPSLR